MVSFFAVKQTNLHIFLQVEQKRIYNTACFNLLMNTLAMAIHDAKEVTIQLSKINWELLDLSYRYEWDDPEWLARKAGESEDAFMERLKPVDYWLQRKQMLLLSIARRIKYESLIGRVVASGHLGKVSSKTVYDTEPMAGVDPNYEILITKPAGDVRITASTNLVLKESDNTF